MDYKVLILEAETEMKEFTIATGDYDQENVEVEDDDYYYDEWDRPGIADVKQLQLSKRPSRQPLKLHKVLSYNRVKDISVDSQKTTAIINQILRKLLELIQIINSDDFSAEAIK